MGQSFPTVEKQKEIIVTPPCKEEPIDETVLQNTLHRVQSVRPEEVARVP
jgi:hypothetical protein